MVTLYRSPDNFGPGNQRQPDLVTAIGAAIVSMVSVIAVGIGIAGCVTGKAKSPVVDPDQTVTYQGQVFGSFQTEDINSFYRVAERVRGKPLLLDPLWNRVPPRDRIIVNGILYTDCRGEKPVVQDRIRYQELACNRQH